MSVLVVGSIALDTIETPYGKVEDALGGSAVYFSLAAGLLGDVRLVGVVGEDFPRQYMDVLAGRRIHTAGLEVSSGKTFRWTGAYRGGMNDAETLAVELNVFGTYDPRIPAAYADTEYVFLANGSPRIQRRVREQMPRAAMVVCDTMNLWIDTARPELVKLLAEVDAVVLNDQETRMLTSCHRLVEAGRRILDMGPKFVVIKKGEHGSLLVARDETFALPAFPTAEVKDPTGAGDSFAGGMMGYLADTRDHSPAGLKRAMACGTVVASLAVEGFGTKALETCARADLDSRYARFKEMLRL